MSAAVENLIWACLFQLCRLAFLSGLCLCMLRLNVSLAYANLESAGILESLRLARTALTELAESLATNARLASTAAESYSVAEPPLFTSMGGFSHVAIDALTSCNLFCFLLAFYFDFLQLCDIGCCAIHCHSEVQIQLSIFVGHTANQLLVVLPALAQTALKPVEGGGGQRRKRN